MTVAIGPWVSTLTGSSPRSRGASAGHFSCRRERCRFQHLTTRQQQDADVGQTGHDEVRQPAEHPAALAGRLGDHDGGLGEEVAPCPHRLLVGSHGRPVEGEGGLLGSGRQVGALRLVEGVVLAVSDRHHPDRLPVHYEREAGESGRARRGEGRPPGEQLLAGLDEKRCPLLQVGESGHRRVERDLRVPVGLGPSGHERETPAAQHPDAALVLRVAHRHRFAQDHVTDLIGAPGAGQRGRDPLQAAESFDGKLCCLASRPFSLEEPHALDRRRDRIRQDLENLEVVLGEVSHLPARHVHHAYDSIIGLERHPGP